MSWEFVLPCYFLGLILMIFTGMPVAIAFFVVNVFSIILLFGLKGLTLLTTSIFASVGNFTFITIPLYVFLGEILFCSGVVKYIFDAADNWIGNIRARLLIVSTISATIFGALTGAAMAVAAMFGSSVYPDMEKRGYDKKLCAGSILGGSSLAAIIPPSILIILVGTLAKVPIAQLLVSGIMPGVLLSILFIIYLVIRVKLNPKLAPLENPLKVSFLKKILSLMKCLPFLLIIFAILGFIFLGIATPTESAGVGILASIIVVGLYRRLNYSLIIKATLGTVKVSGMLFFILAGSRAFGEILGITGLTQDMVESVTSLNLSPTLLCLLMLFIIFILGCFIDQTSIIMITIPLYLPLVAKLGFNVFWYWTIYNIILTVGGITPPFGYVLFALKGATGDLISIEEIYQGSIPFVLITVVGVFIIMLFPEIVTWLPGTIK